PARRADRRRACQGDPRFPARAARRDRSGYPRGRRNPAGPAGASRRPDDLAGLAKQLMDWLHPDGNYTDEDRARKRGLTLGKQEHDGMSRLSGYVDPELR
ncbi:DUF222 domain-containing protein, partial [Mycobacterium szulgai]|nr:DUF222 domain-containing protein [Mycobacterium szulgai]